MKLRLWPRTWSSPRFAWSCLRVQFLEMQAFNAGLNFALPASLTEETTVYHIPDDATEEELTELAEEQRATTERPARETPGTIACIMFSLGSD